MFKYISSAQCLSIVQLFGYWIVGINVTVCGLAVCKISPRLIQMGIREIGCRLELLGCTRKAEI